MATFGGDVADRDTTDVDVSLKGLSVCNSGKISGYSIEDIIPACLIFFIETYRLAVRNFELEGVDFEDVFFRLLQ